MNLNDRGATDTSPSGAAVVAATHLDAVGAMRQVERAEWRSWVSALSDADQSGSVDGDDRAAAREPQALDQPRRAERRVRVAGQPHAGVAVAREQLADAIVRLRVEVIHRRREVEARVAHDGAEERPVACDPALLGPLLELSRQEGQRRR